MKVSVVGGSLGGLITGCLLNDDGHDVTVYERSPTPLEERGAGIGFLPMTARYLAERAAVDVGSISVATNHIRYLARDGSITHDIEHHYLLSSWNTVYREMLQRFPTRAYKLGHELLSLDPHTATAQFSNETSVTSDLLVCADGIGSTTRTQLGITTTPSYAGYVAWRGVVPESELSDGSRRSLVSALTYYVGSNSHILVYPIPGRDGSVDEGQRLINFVWYRNYLAGGELEDLLVDRHGYRREVSLPPGAARDVHINELRNFAQARLPFCLAEVVCAVSDPFVQVVFAYASEQMAFGRTALLGDAAFVARPHAAAGTAKAAADAWALRDAIAAHPNDPLAALASWEPGQLALGRSLTHRTQVAGRRSQVDNDWDPTDRSFIFGLYEPGN